MFINLDKTFCDLDDFWNIFKNEWDNQSQSQDVQETQEDAFALLKEAKYSNRNICNIS